MNIEDIVTRLKQLEGLKHLQIDPNGQHVELDIVSPVFEGLSRLNRQKLVYRHLQDMIADGRLHAVNLHTYTPDEWKWNVLE